MSKVVLHLVNGETLDQDGPDGMDVRKVRDEVSAAIEGGVTINLNQPDGSVFVVNTAHVAYVAVTP